MRKDRLPYTTCAAPLNGPQGKTKTLYTDHLTLNLRVSLRELFKDFHESPPQYFLWNSMCLSTLEQHDSFNVKTTRFDHLADLQGPPPGHRHRTLRTEVWCPTGGATLAGLLLSRLELLQPPGVRTVRAVPCGTDVGDGWGWSSSKERCSRTDVFGTFLLLGIVLFQDAKRYTTK